MWGKQENSERKKKERKNAKEEKKRQLLRLSRGQVAKKRKANMQM
jgi:hypothetical protein